MERPHVGGRILVFWPEDHKSYPGSVTEYLSDKKFKIKYDYCDEEILNLNEEEWRNEELTSPRLFDCSPNSCNDYEPVVDVAAVEQRCAKFHLPSGVDPTAEALCE